MTEPSVVNVWLQGYRLDLLHFSFIQGQEWGSHLSHLQMTTAHYSVLLYVWWHDIIIGFGPPWLRLALVIKRALGLCACFASLNECQEPKFLAVRRYPGGHIVLFTCSGFRLTCSSLSASLLQVFRVGAGCSGKMTTFSQILSGVTE